MKLLFLSCMTMLLLLVSGDSIRAYTVLPDSVPPVDSGHVVDSLRIIADSINFTKEIVLTITHINFDRYQDTIIGRQWQPLVYMPVSIRWGRKNDTLPETIDSAHYVPDSLKVRESLFHYPAWRNMRGNITYDHVNMDTVQDIVFAISGFSCDTCAPVSYKRMVLLFGQDYLDTMSVIDLSVIDSFQFHPFIAINLQPGKELISPEHRDVSRNTSYVFPRISMNVRDTSADTSGMARAPLGVEEGKYMLRVYPNPAVYFTTVEAVTLPSGSYVVEIVNSAGQSFHRQEVDVEQSGELLRRLDLSAIPTGYYLIKVHTGRKLYGVYQILIIH